MPRKATKRARRETVAREAPTPINGALDATRVGGSRKRRRVSRVPALTSDDVSRIARETDARLTVVRKGHAARAHSAQYRTIPDLDALMRLFARLSDRGQ